MINIPWISRKNKSILWNNLSYCGLYQELGIPISLSDLTLPSITTSVVHGKELPLRNNGINKDLRLIGFDTLNTDGPIVTNQSWD